MAYTTNPHIPKVRQEAAHLVHRGWGVRQVARRYGVSPGTITKWVKKANKIGYHPIPTLSSRPKHHPEQLSNEITWRIFHERLKTKRCSEVVHQGLLNQGFVVSLSSVKRTLDRSGLLKKRSPWKRFHPHVDRPKALKPGDLVQIDTIHLMTGPKTRIYVFTLIDTYSRWAYARAYTRMSGSVSLAFVKKAQHASRIQFHMLQSDHGPEFGRWFVTQVKKSHRYTRIGKPNDNAHIERFNRTIQEECLDKTERSVLKLNRALEKYMQYYNNERLHMGIELKAPVQLLAECFQAIG